MVANAPVPPPVGGAADSVGELNVGPNVAPGGSPVVSIAMVAAATPPSASAAPHPAQRPAFAGAARRQRGQTIFVSVLCVGDYGVTAHPTPSGNPPRASELPSSALSAHLSRPPHGD